MKQTRRRRYPWVVWFSRPKLSLEQGRDFEIAPYLMAQSIRNMAPSYGVESLSILIKGRVLDVWINGKPRRGRHA